MDVPEIPVLTSTFITVSSFPTRRLRGSIPSTFRLTAYLLAVLRLKLDVTIQPPRTCYLVADLPSRAGFSPAWLHDLARPHNKSVPFSVSPFPGGAVFPEKMFIDETKMKLGHKSQGRDIFQVESKYTLREPTGPYNTILFLTLKRSL